MVDERFWFALVPLAAGLLLIGVGEAEAAVTPVGSRPIGETQAIEASVELGVVGVLQPGSVSFFETPSLKPLGTYSPYPSTPTAFSLNGGAGTVAVGLSNGSIEVLSFANLTRIDACCAAAAPSSPVVMLRWSYDGAYLAVALGNQATWILDDALELVASFEDPAHTDRFWVEWEGAPALLWSPSSTRFTIHALNGSTTNIGTEADGLDSLHVSTNGTCFGLDAPGVYPPSAYRYISFGAEWRGKVDLLDLAHDSLAPNTATGGFASWGQTPVVTIWDQRWLPSDSIVVPVARPDLVSWMGSSQLLVFGEQRLYSYLVERTTAAYRLTILSPAEGAILSGSANVTGTVDPLNFSARVMFRIDFGPWAFAEALGQWSGPLDTLFFPDGPHVLYAVLVIGDHALAFAQVQVQTSNNQSAFRVPAMAWIVNPRGGEVVSGQFEVLVNAFVPAIPGDTRVVTAVEVWSNRGFPVPLLFEGGWRGNFDSRALSNGQQRLFVHAFDGLAFSPPTWIDVVVHNEPAVELPSVTIAAPDAGATVGATALIMGGLSRHLSASIWIEASTNFGPWVRVPIVGISGSAWEWNAFFGGPTGSRPSVCVRARDDNASGPADCRSFVLGANGVNEPPTIDIREAGATQGNSFDLIEVGGSSTDDHGVQAIFLRVDGQLWIRIDSGTEWRWRGSVAFMTNHTHLLEAMAYDGVLYSPVGVTTVVAVPPETSPEPPGPPPVPNPVGAWPWALSLATVGAVLAIARVWIGRRRGAQP